MTGRTKNEWISPHKLALLTLVRELCTSSPENCVTRSCHSLSFLMIDLLQAPDMGITELCHQLGQIDKELPSLLVNRLEQVYENGSSGVVEFFKAIDELCADDNAIYKESLFGLFARRVGLLYHRMTFSQIAHFFTLFERYMSSAKPDVDCMDESLECTENEMHMEDKQDHKSDFMSFISSSSRQAEFFLSSQASAIQSNESQALPPQELQSKISQLQRASNDIPETHYLSYLNCLRVGEYKQTVDSLHQYFDQQQGNKASSKPAIEGAEVMEEKGQSFRYAAMNLAALHSRLGHRKEALLALQEAINMAQEKDDHVCLEHCLLLLYHLEQEGSTQASELLDRSVTRAKELKLPYMTSLSMLTQTLHDVHVGMPPPKVLQVLSTISTINSQNSLQDLTETTFATRAAVWQLYGKSRMSSVFSQMVLYRNAPTCSHTSGTTHKPSDTQVSSLTGQQSDMQDGEARCLSLCNLAKVYADQGLYDESQEIIQFCKQNFPKPTNLSKIWMVTEAIISHDAAVIQGNQDKAQEAAKQIAGLDTQQARYRTAVNMLLEGRFSEAHTLLLSIQEKCSKMVSLNEGKYSAAELHLHVLLALAQLYILSGNPLSALTHLIDCLTLAGAHYQTESAARASLLIAQLQLLLGLPGKALELVKSNMVQILAHGSLYTQSCALFLLVKCEVAAHSPEGANEKRKSTLLSALPTLARALEGFRKLRAMQRICDLLYYQARIYNELGYQEERNHYSAECCKLLQDPLVKNTAGRSFCCL
ncbi:anaphase-promoting complex subunit 5 [Nematostella vectensis]|uniref:anaphase-promoting complex subunit 5 n=1 Tax=Nematostella vectensis TaxID=45351 RepID=UPI002077598E|nr:anaphase-promoting complex subunit 5 [Nematostella vectensis]